MANMYISQQDEQPMPDFAQQQTDIDRRRKYAEMLLSQGLKQDDPNQVVAGRVVPYSWTQGLAKMLQAYSGRKGLEQADEQAQQLAAQQRNEFMNTAQKYAAALRGTPAQMEQMAPDVAGPPREISPAVPGSRDAAMMVALGSNSPQWQQMAMQQMIPQKPVVVGRSLLDPSSGSIVGVDQTWKEEQNAARMQRMEELRQKAEDAKALQDDRLAARRELAQLAGSLRQSNPYFQPVQTANGVMAFDARSGKVTPVMSNGMPVVGAANDVTLQGNLAGAKAGGKERGEAQAKSEIELPSYVAQAQQTDKLVDDLLSHPGFSSAVGMSSLNPVNMIPGTKAKDFNIRLDQLKGQQFMQAYNNLRGGGQITEVEGKKATDAISRMNTASSEQEFQNAAREFQGVIRAGIERAKQKAGGVNRPNSAPSFSLPSADAIEEELRRRGVK